MAQQANPFRALSVLSIILAIICLGLLMRLVRGDSNLNLVASLHEEVAQESLVVAELRARNFALNAEVDNLKNHEEAIEERARVEMGMVKPNEQYIQLVEVESNAS